MMTGSSYLRPMKVFRPEDDDDRGPRNHLGAISDLWTYVKEDRPHRWASMGLAITIPAVVFYVIYRSLIQPEPGPTIVYVESWPLDRSQADVEKDWRERARQANEDNAKRRKAYRAVADSLGIDYEKAPGTEGGTPVEAAPADPKAAPDKASAPAPAAPPATDVKTPPAK